MNTEDPTNLDLLKLATELVYADYNNRRANIHNKWLADTARLKSLYGRAAPYPPIPPYPTERDIIDKAQKLILFLNTPRPDLDKDKIQESVGQLITDITQEKELKPVTETNSEKPKDTVAEKKPAAVPNNVPTERTVPGKTSVIDKIKKRVAFNF